MKLLRAMAQSAGWMLICTLIVVVPLSAICVFVYIAEHTTTMEFAGLLLFCLFTIGTFGSYHGLDKP